MENYFMDHYIIFDVEIVERSRVKEISEISSIKLNETLEIIDTFNSKTESLVNILPKFEGWIKKGQADNKIMYSWGRTQRNQIIEEAKSKNYNGDIFDLLLYFSSLQHVLKNMKDDKLYTIKNAMKILNIEYIERKCLMDDVNNTVKIFNEIYGKWIHPGNPVFPQPGEKIFTGKKYWLNK